MCEEKSTSPIQYKYIYIYTFIYKHKTIRREVVILTVRVSLFSMVFIIWDSYALRVHVSQVAISISK